MPKTRPTYSQGSFFNEAMPIHVPFESFPKTRYQGSKRRLLTELHNVFSHFTPGTALDLYSGTATVSLLLRIMGWRVTANDYLSFNNVTARVLLGEPVQGLTPQKARSDLQYLLYEAKLKSEPLVSTHFSGIYFHDEENMEIDRFCQNIDQFSAEIRNLYIYGLGQSLLMKRPYNLFHRANLNMRTRSVARSFGNVKTWNTPSIDHASKIVNSIINIPHLGNHAKGFITSQNTLNLAPLPDLVDLVYLDPPYLNSSGQGVDYCSFYHFLDGLCDYSRFSSFNERYPHKPIVANPSAWMREDGALDELARVLRKWPRSTIVLSYRSDGRPEYDDIANVFRMAGREFQTTDAHDFKYALSQKSGTKELFLISAPI